MHKTLLFAFIACFFLHIPLSHSQCWQSVSAGIGHNLGIKTDGSLWAWGGNYVGQLGNATFDNSNHPIQVAAPVGWLSVSAGVSHSAAVRSDGTLWTWGGNISGALGIGTSGGNSFVPVQVGQEADWKTVVAGSTCTFAIKTDGTLWAWGGNNSGRLGNGNTTTQLSPVQVGTDNDWETISSGGIHTVGLKTNGALWGWGNNSYGQLGLPQTTQTLVPMLISEEVWLKISAGSYHVSGIKEDGTLWATGSNENGQIGDGSYDSRTEFAQVGTVSTWRSVNAGENHTMAIRTNGSLWGTGQNTFGALGVGSTADKIQFTQAGFATDWRTVSAGEYHTQAIKNSGALWAAGLNESGEIGNGLNNNATGFVSISCPVLSIADLEVPQHDLVLYPNPASSILHLRLGNAQTISSVNLYDLSGKKIREQQSVETVLLDGIAPGLYLVEVVSEGISYHKKFVKSGS